MRLFSSKTVIGLFAVVSAALGLAACSDRPAPPAAQKTAAPASAAPAARVEAWGPTETKRGVAVNRQPDGASAIWIRVAGIAADPATRVTFGGQQSSPATVTPELVTTAVPQSVIDTAGDYPVVIEEPGGRRTPVGTFRVAP